MNTNINNQPERSQVTIRTAAPPPRRAVPPPASPKLAATETGSATQRPVAKSSKQSGFARLGMAALAFTMTVSGCVAAKQLGASASLPANAVAQLQTSTDSSTTTLLTQSQTAQQTTATQALATTRSSQ